MAYIVRKLEGTGIFIEHPERYALMRPGGFKKKYEHSMPEASPEELGGYLAITYKNKTIYRKYRGCNRVKSYEIILDHRTICELSAKTGDELSVEKSTWRKYYFCNSDPGIRRPARMARLGLILTIISLVLTIVSFFFPNCICCNC